MSVIRTINLELDFRRSVNDLLRQVIDADTGKQLRMFRADSTRFSMVFKDGENDFDMSGVSKISLEVKPRACTNPPTPLMPLWMYGETETIPDDGDPAIIEFAAEETALPDGGAWMTVTLYGAADEVLTTVSGNITVLGNGRGEFADVPDVEDARDEAIAAANRAEDARDAAEGYRDQAQTAAGTATTARNQAVAAKNDAESARDDAISARNAAQNARNAAQAAQAGAETARDQANTARNQAQTAQGAAEGARDAAQGYRNEALSFRNAAQGAATAATDEADRSEAAANTATTQANRSQGQADRAQGIADNLEALSTSLSYRGEWAGTTAPSDAQRGWFWMVGGAGVGATWGGYTWALGDAALYNGSVWQRVALDTLLAQANANIEALQNALVTKDTAGGVYTVQSGYFTIPGLTCADLAGGSFSFAAHVNVEQLHERFYAPVIGTLHPEAAATTGGAGLAVVSVAHTGAQLIGAADFVNQRPSGGRLQVVGTSDIRQRWAFVIGVYNAETGKASIYVDGVRQAEADWVDLNMSFTAPIAIMSSSINGRAGFPINQASPTGSIGHASIYKKALTSTETAALTETSGAIIPMSARAACQCHYQFDEGTGYIARDLSGNGRHALMSAAGCTHLIPGDGTPISAEAVDASSATYFMRSDTILPSNAVVVGAIVDGEYLPAEGAQNLTHLRIRLNPSGGDLQVQRSNGTTHQTLATFTPASLASVNVTILYRLIK